MSLGPLQVSSKSETPPVQEDPNIAQFRELAPNCFATPEPIIYRDPVREAMEHEEHIKAVWRRDNPKVFAARERLDAADQKHRAASDIFKARQHEEILARNALNHVRPESPVGDKADRTASLHICRGFLQVAKFNLEVAEQELTEAREKLAAVTAVKP